MAECVCGALMQPGTLGLSAVGPLMLDNVGFKPQHGGLHMVPRSVRAMACDDCGRVELRLA